MSEPTLHRVHVTWTMQSMDISSVGKAPDVEFAISDDRARMEASPPGGHIAVRAMERRGAAAMHGEPFTYHVVLTNTITGSVYADVAVRHISAGELPEEWNSPTLYAGEIACSLYWSMWRMQQLCIVTSGGKSADGEVEK